jgi:hypothetical protein
MFGAVLYPDAVARALALARSNAETRTGYEARSRVRSARPPVGVTAWADALLMWASSW